ncbi:hypothetical protein CFP56_029108 [Quercus suber]|uniref:Uncharacterized protein n=1 Tax=Quercus suber TaxID=58331 RepID=A0AAW0MC15_QUESU
MSYSSTIVTQCKGQPEKALYNGGILKDDEPVSVKGSIGGSASIVFWPAFILHNLTQGIWVTIQGAESALIKASLKSQDVSYDCIGTNSDDKQINIEITSASVQPFTKRQWRINQQHIINTGKRVVTIHVSDENGDKLQGAAINIEQVLKDFPFGSAIAKTILGNFPYQAYDHIRSEHTKALQSTNSSFVADQNVHPAFGQLRQEVFLFHGAPEPTPT